MAKKIDQKKSCRRSLTKERLHKELGRVLILEKTDRNQDAREANEQNRMLPKSLHIPFLP